MVRPAYQRLKIRLVRIDGVEDLDHYSHEVLMIKFKSGEAFILDFAAAPYGHHGTVTPFGSYLDPRSEISWPSQWFGYWREKSRRECDDTTTTAGFNRQSHEVICELFDDAVKYWQENNISLSAMLKLPEKAHKSAQARSCQLR